MSGVDSRIVTMKFDNSQFESGVKTTLGTLDKLKSALSFPGAGKGLTDVSDAAGKFNLNPVTGAVTGVSNAFIALSTVAITALSNITNKAIDAGMQLAKSLTIDPIKQGFDEYELKMGSIQTILANTARYGTKLSDVTASLDELNTYADKTIYNFGDMTKNIGLFTNAGIKIEDATSMIKGFSNSAAASGTNAEGASHAAYQLSQALSNGKITLMDWKSLTNVGMGNKNMQDGLIDLADAMGTFEGTNIDASVAGENFNKTLEKGWLEADVMSNYLKIMAGDMDAAAMKSLGLSDAQIKTFQEQAKTAEDAATKVRTLTQLIGTMREAVGSGWSETFGLIFGDFDEATEMFTDVNNVFSEMISASSDARNKVIGDWKALGGRQVLIEGISNAFHALIDVLKPIKEAFRDIFPAKTGQNLYDMTVAFRDFTEKLKIGEETAANLKRTFKGVFAIFSIIGQVIKGVIGVVGDLFGALTGGAGGGFLSMTAGIGDFLVKVDEFLKKSGLIKGFFQGLGAVISAPIKMLKALAGFMGSLFGGFGGEQVDPFGRMTESLSPLENLLNRIRDAYHSVADGFGKLGQAFKPFIDKFIDGLQSIGEALGKAFSGGNFSGVLDMINTGLFGGIVLLLKNFLKDFTIFGDSGAGGMFGSITKSFESLSGVLTTMQTNIKADTLMKIAIAVGILTVSIVAMSLIDSDKLTKALAGIGVAFGELLAAMAILDKISSNKGFIKMPFITASMTLLATAVLILSAAVKTLSELSWGELLKGLSGVAAVMTILVVAMKPLTKDSGKLAKSAGSLLILAIALKVMAGVIQDFASMGWGEIAKGLAGVAASLGTLGLAIRLMPKNMAAIAISVGILSVALKILASVVEDFGAMSFGQIVKGLVGMAGALVVIAVAIRLMPKNMVVTAASLILVGIALESIADAVTDLGGMTWGEVAIGLTTLAGALVILAAGLYLMSGSLMGSAALIVAAGALAILTPVLVTLGAMEWGEIVKGLAALAGVFVVLGVAGLVLGPIVPIILALGAAVALLGAGLALAGLGVLAFVTALAILVSLGAAAAVVVGAMLAEIAAAIPEMLRQFGEGIVAFAGAIAEGYPEFVKAMTTILTALLQAITNSLPKIEKLFEKLVAMAINVLTDSLPKLQRAGLELLLALLDGIGDNIYKIVTKATKIITEFIRGIGDNLPKVVDEGAKTVIKFINGVSDAIDNNSEELGRAGGRMAAAIIRGMVKGLLGGVSEIAGAAKRAAGAAFDAAKDVLGISSPSKEFYKIGRYVDEGLALGMTDYTKVVDKASEEVGDTALSTMKSTMAQLSDVMASDIDMNPVIAPVLDLTRLKADAEKANAMLQTTPLVPGVSFDQATSLSAAYQAAQTASFETAAQPAAPIIQFEQNNYSPKELSPVEIYRQTKNQLSLAKGALTV